jgi:phosphoglycolate phosphatase-like HAD superfamily hydrolase
VDGAGKREAIQALLHAGGDAVVDTAFADFRRRLTTAYRDPPPEPFPGVTDMIASTRAAGIRVALTTGFDREVSGALPASIGRDSGVDAVVCVQVAVSPRLGSSRTGRGPGSPGGRQR